MLLSVIRLCTQCRQEATKDEMYTNPFGMRLNAKKNLQKILFDFSVIINSCKFLWQYRVFISLIKIYQKITFYNFIIFNNLSICKLPHYFFSSIKNKNIVLEMRYSLHQPLRKGRSRYVWHYTWLSYVP